MCLIPFNGLQVTDQESEVAGGHADRRDRGRVGSYRRQEDLYSQAQANRTGTRGGATGPKKKGAEGNEGR